MIRRRLLAKPTRDRGDKISMRALVGPCFSLPPLASLAMTYSPAS
jgi:hypothetical protein